ncbi:hypothetical protein NW762_001866 [Fusarium torreyae]|uniref:Uncharacterized protein n=1 Tax=Fusarium torreyae TaxID=1237075 RepID=A0A9W8SEA3_9HYPO|nr:hypothetical protein NW762_001866 [Fusarium torreyae]
MADYRKARIINEVVKRLWNEQPDAAMSLKRYMAETDHIKDIMQAVVKDIGYAMVELDLRDEKAIALNRCKHDLAHAVDEHNRLTKDCYDRNFRPRLNCVVKSLKLIGVEKNGESDGTEGKDNEPQMEVTLRFPAHEYNDSPHSLTPGKDNVFIMMKEW